MPLWKPTDVEGAYDSSTTCSMWVRPESLPVNATCTIWQNDADTSTNLTAAVKSGGTRVPQTSDGAVKNGYTGASYHTDKESYFTSSASSSTIGDVGYGCFLFYCYLENETVNASSSVVPANVNQFIFANDALTSSNALSTRAANRGVWHSTKDGAGGTHYTRSNLSDNFQGATTANLTINAKTGNVTGGVWTYDSAQTSGTGPLTTFVGCARTIAADGTNQKVQTYFAGAALAESTASSGSINMNDSGAFILGNDNGFDESIRGSMFEACMIHMGSTFHEDIRDRMEGYLAWKYDDLLPDSDEAGTGGSVHTYKQGPPTTCHCVAGSTLSTTKLTSNPVIPYTLKEPLNVYDRNRR
ncbi:MAG TPA: hypothetical protein DF712_03860 [Balneola sp.]|nr:hypothetical protein [Balneola sp.]|tara:strand:- start:1656 stop:2726 length:1071 start_codon:yes stop_codon:yes gene_type:complete